MNELGLGMVFSAKDLASGVMQRVGKNMLDVEGKSSAAGIALQKNFAAFSTGMAVFGTGATLLAGATALANVSGQFNKALAGVGAIAQASAADMKLLHDAAIEAGIATQFSPQEAVDGLGQLSQAGYNATEATKLLIPTLDLAAGGELSVAQAASTMSSAVKIFGLSMEEAGLATDKLLRISNATSLKASELESALGAVARGASVTGQSLDEMLPAMGLVRNTGVDASVAASSVSSALLMVAQNASKFKSDLGVEVTDAAGNFRPLMDIIQQTDVALSKKFPNAAERSAKALDLFGKFGLTAFSGISAQLKGGITGAAGDKVFGQGAIEDLRKRMAGAAGAAKEFREKLLDTFEGQKTLLAGSIQTMGVLLGEPLERALKPVVSAVLDMFNRVLGVVKSMPDGMKDFLAKLVLGAGSLLTLVGGFIAGKAAIAMFVIGLKAIGVTVGGVIATMAPALVVVGALIGLFYALKYAYDNNIAGMGGQWGLISTAIFKVKMAFSALVQLFTEGGLSGDALSGYLGGEEAVNFAIDLYVAFNKVKEFLDGFSSGFSSRVGQMGPTFERLGAAVERLFNALGLGTKVDVSKNAEDMARWGKAGESAGNAAAAAIDGLVRALTSAVDFVTGFVDNFKSIKDSAKEMKPAFEEIATSVNKIGEAFGNSGPKAESGVSEWRQFGRDVAATLSFVVSLVSTVVRELGNQFGFLGTFFTGLSNIVGGVFQLSWTRVWLGIKQVAASSISSILSLLGMVVEQMAKVIDFFGSVFGERFGLTAKVQEIRAAIKEALTVDVPRPGGNQPPAPPLQPPGGAVDGGTPWSKDLVDFYSVPAAADLPFAPTVDNVAAAQGEAQMSVDVEGLNASIADLKAAKSGDTTMSGTVVLNDDVVGQFSAKKGSGPISPVQVD